MLISSLISCKSKPLVINEETKFDSKSAEMSSIQKKFNTIKKEIENIYLKDTSRIELYIQIDENGTIKRVSNYNNSTESFYASYNIIRNKSGEIIYIQESPSSESGDWNLDYDSYFDDNGNLIAFVRTCSFFSGENDEIIRERSQYFYDSKYNLIKKTYEIKDKNNKPLDVKKCTIEYRFSYTIYTTSKEYLNKHKFN